MAARSDHLTAATAPLRLLARKPPAYATIREVLARRISEGAVPPGAILLETAVATLFECGRSPVRQAFEQLARLGIVRRVHGRGVIVGSGAEMPHRIPVTPEMLGLYDGAARPGRADAWDAFYYDLERDIIHRSAFGRCRINELAVARHFGVGRTVARNLLVRAQASGLIEKDEKGHWQVVALDEDRVRDIYELRLTLEPMLLRTAADHIPRDALGGMEARLRSVTTSFPSVTVAELDELETDLHIHCLSFGTNREMVEVLKRTRCSLVIGKHMQAAMVKYPQIDPFMDEHLDVIEALLRHDGDRAVAALHRHLSLTSGKAAERFKAFRAAKSKPEISYMLAG